MTRRTAIQVLSAIGAMGLTGPAHTSERAFWVPAEEGPHEATFMQWPVSRNVYRNRAYLERIQSLIAEIANTIAAFEPVIMLAAASEHATIRAQVAGNVRLWDVPTDDLWCRDSGPIFAVNRVGDRAVIQIQFNGWGNKQTHKNDAQVAARVADRLGLAVRPSGLIGEGGGVEQDGHGLLMAHESCWVNRNRNPRLSQFEIETRLLHAYGAERIVWAPGLKGEDITDYHIDSLARFTGAGRVLMNLPDVPDDSDPFHRAALNTHDLLKGAGLDVDVISEPRNTTQKGAEFVASYVNYYVCNGAVITAQFGDLEMDQAAQSALRRHYPGREVVALNVDALGDLGGGIHCATQQFPAA